MAEYLSSWNDGVAKSGILEFVRPVTEEKRGSRPSDRATAFDHDGALA